MSETSTDIDSRADVLFTYFYDEEMGGFYTSYEDKQDGDIEPSLFSTSEALFALLQSPAKDEYRQEIAVALEFLVDKLANLEQKAPPYGNAEKYSPDYSTLSISFSLIVLTRGQKFIDRHQPSKQLSEKLDTTISTQLELLLDARYDDGWGYTPNQCVPEDYEFSEDVYCTAIALQALINCRDAHFESQTAVDVDEARMIVVRGVRSLTQLAEIPEAGDLETLDDASKRTLYDDAVLMTHWMHVLSHLLYDTRWWAEDVDAPGEIPRVQELLNESSFLLRDLVLNIDTYPEELEHGFASLEYSHQLAYPRRTSQGRLEKDSFTFELPGTTALPALVLNPHIPIWSDANTNIYQDVLDQFDAKESDLRRYAVEGGSLWPIYHFSAPLVGISYMESINQSIIGVIRYFIREGDLLTERVEEGDGYLTDSSSETEAEGRSETSDSEDTDPTTSGELGTASDGSPSWIVRTAYRIDGTIDSGQNWIAEYRQRDNRTTRLALIPLFLMTLFGYGYAVVEGHPDVEILALASLSGLVGFLTIYAYVLRLSENRPAAILSGALGLLVISVSTAVTTAISQNIIIVASAIMQGIAIISNIIVSSSGTGETQK